LLVNEIIAMADSPKVSGWIKINDDQTVTWSLVGNNQNPNWVEINNSQ
jgi:hypothetical protein